MALKFKIQKYKKFILLVAGILILTLVYSINFFDISNIDGKVVYFPKFQKDSENLIIASVLTKNYTDFHIDPYGLAILRNNETNIYVPVDEEIDAAKQKINQTEVNNIKPYKSLVGLQGHVVNFFYRLGIKNFSIFRLGSAFLTAVVLIGICYMIQKNYNTLLASIFFVTFALSPWITAFARNLYWAVFLWFLPLLLVFIYQQMHNPQKIKQRLVLVLICFAVFVKSLCGYEYLSAIMIIAVIPIILDFFKTKKRIEKIEAIKNFLKISIVMVVGFMLAFIIHANMRGNGNIIDGAKDIYRQDVERRLSVGKYYNEDVAILNESKKISTVEVLKKYISFETPLLIGLIGGGSFTLILVASFLFLVSDLLKDCKKIKFDLILWLLMLAAPLSWYILAKPHSYIHTHVNYVLWYFGFIQVSLYVIVKRALLFIKNFKGEKEKYADLSW